MKSHLNFEIENESTERTKPVRANNFEATNFIRLALEEENKDLQRREDIRGIDVPIRSFLRVVFAL